MLQSYGGMGKKQHPGIAARMLLFKPLNLKLNYDEIEIINDVRNP